jgi:hypothetical protein
MAKTFELHGKWVSDSKLGVAYHGPLKTKEELSENIQRILRANPDLISLRGPNRAEARGWPIVIIVTFCYRSSDLSAVEALTTTKLFGAVPV